MCSRVLVRVRGVGWLQGHMTISPPGNQRGLFCEPLGGPAGTQGVYPGRSWTYGSVNFTICQDFFYNLVIFL